MDRLTNKKTADELRHNIAGLIAKGIEPSALDIRYVKLADYEDEEERQAEHNKRDDQNNNTVGKVKFVLDGCDIAFTAEAPEDITLKQLLKQCDRIVPNYCACGIRSAKEGDWETELIIGYNSIEKVDDYVSCRILPLGGTDNE